MGLEDSIERGIMPSTENIKDAALLEALSRVSAGCSSSCDRRPTMIPPLRMASEQPFDGEKENNPVASSSPPDGGNPLVVNLGGWQLHRAGNCRSTRTLEALEHGSAAKHWLQGYRKDPFAMTAMRSVLSVEGAPGPMSRLRAEDVIEQVAHLVKSGLWHVCQPVMRVYNVLVAEEPAIMPVPRWGSAVSAPPPPVSDIPDPATLPSNADEAAIAAAMTLASQLGVPFCEECFKRAVRRAATQAAVA